MKVKKVLSILREFAPLELALNWDNVGLLIGDGEEEVVKVLLTLDVTESAISKAIKEGCNLIISHHPIIFGKISKINNPLFLKLIRNRVDVIALHTNLDVVEEGVNGVLAEMFNLQDVRFLTSESSNKVLWGRVFTTQDNSESMKKVIGKAGAGIYPKYTHCSATSQVMGSFIPNSKSNPTIGDIDIKEDVAEVEIQFRVDSIKKQAVIQAIKREHPYETPVYMFHEIEDGNSNFGLGIVGELEEAMPLEAFAKLVKTTLSAPYVQLWKANKENTLVQTIGISGGSGNQMVGVASRNCDILITGDITYHVMLDSTMPIIDAGHFYTEQPVLKKLAQLLQKEAINYVTLKPEEHEINQLELI